MPTNSRRARRWVKSGKATPFWKKGIWCVRLNIEPSARNIQPVAVGIDPGSKREGYTAKSASATYLNIQATSVDWVKARVESRRNLRRSRRSRNTPCRKPRWANRRKAKLAPSIRARWGLKLRVLSWLRKMYPVSAVIVEDIKARTLKNSRKWNVSFSPLEVGKNCFYAEIRSQGLELHTLSGWETKGLRDELGLSKAKAKLSERFESHCVDSWVLANWFTGGHTTVDDKTIVAVSPLKKHYRQLHVQNFAKGGVRKSYGSTRSMGFERGSIVIHPKYGECLVGGTRNGRVSLHDRTTNARLCQNAKPEDIHFRSFNSFTFRRCESLD